MRVPGKKRPAVVSTFLIGFPLIVMVVSAALAGVTLNGSSSNNFVCNQNNLVSAEGKPTSCVGTPGSVSYSCPILSGVGGLSPCAIQDPVTHVNLACPANPPPPSYCGPTIPIFHPNPTWFLPRGDVLTVSGTLLTSDKTGVFFGLGTVGPSGFIAVIGIIIGIVCLAGLTVFGTGAGTESVHILFMGGLMMGAWIFLSGIEGFVAGSPHSLFTQMDASYVSLGGIQLGTTLYILFTFMYLIGLAGMVKRGV